MTDGVASPACVAGVRLMPSPRERSRGGERQGYESNALHASAARFKVPSRRLATTSYRCGVAEAKSELCA